jgi:CheY-like chemotaxis protein
LLVDAVVKDQPEKPYQPSRYPSVPPEFLLSIGRDFLADTKLLVVDDEYDACEALAGLLERYGAKVTCVTSVASAMDAIRVALPDVVISDLAIPQEDGYELIRKLRILRAETGEEIPAIAVSAYNKAKHRQRALKAGFQLYLEKPVAPSELMRAVAKLARHDTSSLLLSPV